MTNKIKTIIINSCIVSLIVYALKLYYENQINKLEERCKLLHKEKFNLYSELEDLRYKYTMDME